MKFLDNPEASFFAEAAWMLEMVTKENLKC